MAAKYVNHILKRAADAADSGLYVEVPSIFNVFVIILEPLGFNSLSGLYP